MTSPNENQITHLPVDELDLDWSNPRFASNDHDPERTQDELAAIMDRKYNALAVAQSIARHGYFPSEPLIAIRDNGRYRVLEGNRRLAALKALHDEDLRVRLGRENSGWFRLDTPLPPPTEVPVIVVEREQDVYPLLGFRHISGIDPWAPYQQAQFIARLVDDESVSLEEVAKLVGRPLTEVRSMYRDFDTLRRARELGVDVSAARDRFGVFTAAMGRPAIRSFIGAPDPAGVDPDFWPFPDENSEKVAELLGFLFGSEGLKRVVSDSRQIKELVAVMQDDSGAAIEVLRQTRDLDEALLSIGHPQARVTRALVLANRHLRDARDAVEDSLPPEARRELAEAIGLVEQLSAKSEES